jgi:CheY-like chemotaxis protein
MPKQTITIIEDDAAIRRFVAINLEMHGYHIEEAEDGPKGLRLIKSIRPDLLILDYRLTGLNGEEILKAMLADPALKTISVVLLTASMTINIAEFPNICVHLVKPVDAKTLINTVQQFLPTNVA